ncbi:hypothetical protein CH370_03435 [Leptospira kmetyi]|uniref:hypothetical protein n=1 Tax=Leptospira kmetyi TaxID=408139 RepID=UPI000C2B27D4|nr:hypothetical protein [Leptospira kmetyi]PJZ43484.1 hypothetical protein CH370_03435 [Leptospira kmetyi]
MIVYTLGWFLLLVFAFINAAVRELVYKNATGEFLSHQISVFTGMIFLSIPIWAIVRFKPFKNKKQAIQVGLIWILLTETFEFTMIVFEGKDSLETFWEVHSLWKGECWPLLLIWIGLAPFLFYKSFR